MPSDLALDFWRSRTMMIPLTDKWRAEYQLQPLAERIADLPTGENMRRCDTAVHPAWWCTENSKIYPWICRGCGEYFHDKVTHQQSLVHWVENCAVCMPCSRSSRMSLSDMRQHSLLKLVRKQWSCFFCDSQVRRAGMVEGEAVGFCNSCYIFWTPDISLGMLRVVIEASKNKGGSGSTLCALCSKDTAGVMRNYHFEREIVCRKCYSKFTRLLVSGKPLLTTCRQWASQIKYRGFCIGCNSKRCKWIDELPICFACQNNKNLALSAVIPRNQ